MKRKELLKSKEFHVFEIQNALFNTIENYRKEKGISKTQLASELGVTKGYITQVLNGDFDHKISKLVELSLASGKVPVLSFMDLEKYIEEDGKKEIKEKSQRPIQFITNVYLKSDFKDNDIYTKRIKDKNNYEFV